MVKEGEYSRALCPILWSPQPYCGLCCRLGTILFSDHHKSINSVSVIFGRRALSLRVFSAFCSSMHAEGTCGFPELQSCSILVVRYFPPDLSFFTFLKVVILNKLSIMVSRYEMLFLFDQSNYLESLTEIDSHNFQRCYNRFPIKNKCNSCYKVCTNTTFLT